MVIESSLDLMMLLLYSPGSSKKKYEPVRDTMRLVKLLFLLVKEGGFQKFENEFGFESYDYGPWGGQIYDNIEALKNVNLITTKEEDLQALDEGIADNQVLIQTVDISLNIDKVSIYSLTENGIKVAQHLYDNLSETEKKNIEDIKKKFNHMALHNLIEYVYSRYRSFTTRSKIKEKVLGKSMFGVSPDLPKFEREEEDFRD